MNAHQLHEHDDPEPARLDQLAQAVLERFVTRFDQACAARARRDPSSQGRWTRAYEGLDWREDLHLSHGDIASVLAAVTYARVAAPQLLWPLSQWRQDWEVILTEQDHLSEQEADTLRRKALLWQVARFLVPS